MARSFSDGDFFNEVEVGRSFYRPIPEINHFAASIRYRQSYTGYTTLPRPSLLSSHSLGLLVEESPATPVGAGIVEFVRIYTGVPAQRTRLETVNYSHPARSVPKPEIEGAIYQATEVTIYPSYTENLVAVVTETYIPTLNPSSIVPPTTSVPTNSDGYPSTYVGAEYITVTFNSALVQGTFNIATGNTISYDTNPIISVSLEPWLGAIWRQTVTRLNNV